MTTRNQYNTNEEEKEEEEEEDEESYVDNSLDPDAIINIPLGSMDNKRQKSKRNQKYKKKKFIEKKSTGQGESFIHK